MSVLTSTKSKLAKRFCTIVEKTSYYNPIEVEAEHARITELMSGSFVVGLARLVH